MSAFTIETAINLPCFVAMLMLMVHLIMHKVKFRDLFGLSRALSALCLYTSSF